MTLEQLQTVVESGFSQQQILLVLTLLTSPLLGFVAGFFASYMSEKGKNRATKEDIHEITTKIEGVKKDVTKELEHFRVGLSARLEFLKARYAKELEIYKELWAHLIDFKRQVELLPYSDDTGEVSERRKLFLVANSKLHDFIALNRPFFPRELHDATAVMAGLGFLQMANASPAPGISVEQFDDLSAREEEIDAAIGHIENAIRKRMASFDEIETPANQRG
jgi:hypothetical protein